MNIIFMSVIPHPITRNCRFRGGNIFEKQSSPNFGEVHNGIGILLSEENQLYLLGGLRKGTIHFDRFGGFSDPIIQRFHRIRGYQLDSKINIYNLVVVEARQLIIKVGWRPQPPGLKSLSQRPERIVDKSYKAWKFSNNYLMQTGMMHTYGYNILATSTKQFGEREKAYKARKYKLQEM